jgi:transcription initiation factor TFIID subunit 10
MADNQQPPANADAEMNIDEEAALEADTNAEATQPDAMNLDGANDTDAPQRNGTTEAVPLEARIPAKKDATLREFLSKMDDYAPIVGRTPLLAASWLSIARYQTQSQTTT